MMDFSVLGPLRVTDSDGVVEIRGAKERTALAHLVAFRGRAVPASALVESLWGADPPRSAAKALQTYVLRLRNALEPDRDGAPRLLVTDGQGYRLVAEPAQVDAERFARLAALGRRAWEDGRVEEAATTLREALSLWRGQAYAGFETTPFGQAEGRRLEELRVAATEDRWAAELELNPSSVVAELERLVAEEPLRERLWSLLVLALYRADRQGDALRALERARTTLADELGVDPGPELRRLHARVLAQDPALQAQRPRATVPAELAPPPRPLVGRDAELERLRAAWRRARAGHAVTVAVRGPAGGGATRLAQELADEAAHEGADVRLVTPGARGASPTPGPHPARRPTLVVVDHAQAPAAEPGSMVLVLARPGGPVPAGADVVDLAPLGPAAVRTLVGQYVDGDALADAAAEVLRRTGGWPGAVHAEALHVGRRAAAQRVGAAVGVADASSARLEQARAVLVDGVTTLNETKPGPAPDPQVCPWRGLASYGVPDAPWFAGRERLVAQLVARVAGARLLAVVGASGSGKSSAVHAGLVASLADGVLPGSQLWTQILMRPGPHPMRELARQAMGHREPDVADLLAHLVRADGAPDDHRTVLVVDQLEEVWTACHDPGERAAFLDTLAEVARDPRSPVTVVLVLRADHVGAVAEHPALAGLLADATVLVGSPTPEEVRRAVERPAQRGGVRLEDGLADAIVTDAGAEPGLLPLLSTAMAQLWERRSENRLTFAAYLGTGGLTGAIAHLAEEAYTALGTEDGEAARVLLLRLTGPAEGKEVARRRVPLTELDGLAHPRVREVALLLAQARLLTVSDGHVEVAHEALFREWPRLAGWLTEDAAGRAVQRRLAAAASEWAAEEQDPALLWRGPRLASALDVTEAHPEEVTATERAFLDAARDAVDAERRGIEERAATTSRQNRRLRGLLAGVAVLLVVAMVAGVLAVRSRETAEASRVAADARRLAATAVNEEYLDLALLTAVEAVHSERGPETLGALLTLLSRSPDIITQTRTANRFLRAGVSPDGETVYLAENENVLHALDADTGEQRWVVGTESQPIEVHHGTSGLLVGGLESVSMLDPRTGERIWAFGVDETEAALDGAGDPFLLSLAGWAPDGRIATATRSHLLLLTAEGRVSEIVPWGPDVQVFPPAPLVAWPDGRISVGNEVGEGFVLDPAQPALGLQPLPGVVHAVTTDGRLAVMSDRDGGTRLELYDAATLQPVPGVASMRLTTGNSVRFSPDGSVVVVGDGEVVRLFDTATGAEIRQLVGHSGSVMGSVFAGPDDDVLWTAGRDGTGIAWDLSGTRGALRSSPLALDVRRGESSVGSRTAVVLVMPPDELNLPEAALHLVDTATGQDLATLERPEPCPCNLLAVDISADGRTAVAGYEVQMEQSSEPGAPYVDGADHLAVYDVPSGRLRATVPFPWHPLGIGLTADGTRAVVNGDGGQGIVDLVSGEVVGESPQPPLDYFEVLQSAEVSPDGTRAVLGRAGVITLVDMASGEITAEVPVEGPGTEGATGSTRALSFTWTPDGSTVVAGDVKGWVRFLDGRTLEPVAPARLITGGWILDLAASPDGRMVASLGTDGDIVLWDTATWKPLGQPLSDERGWGLLAFDPERPVLRALYESHERLELSVDPDDWLRDACRIAGRELTPNELAIVAPGREEAATCSALT